MKSANRLTLRAGGEVFPGRVLQLLLHPVLPRLREAEHLPPVHPAGLGDHHALRRGPAHRIRRAHLHAARQEEPPVGLDTTFPHRSSSSSSSSSFSSLSSLSSSSSSSSSSSYDSVLICTTFVFPCNQSDTQEWRDPNRRRRSATSGYAAARRQGFLTEEESSFEQSTLPQVGGCTS
jgi:hypothetical protein